MIYLILSLHIFVIVGGRNTTGNHPLSNWLQRSNFKQKGVCRGFKQIFTKEVEMGSCRYWRCCGMIVHPADLKIFFHIYDQLISSSCRPDLIHQNFHLLWYPSILPAGWKLILLRPNTYLYMIEFWSLSLNWLQIVYWLVLRKTFFYIVHIYDSLNGGGAMIFCNFIGGSRQWEHAC